MNLLNLVKGEKFISTLILLGLLLLISAIPIFLWKDNIDLNQDIDASKFGQFGDFIGGVIGTLWALASVILFYLALSDQRKDFKTNENAFKLQVDALNQQIEEFKLQRNELENSRKIYEEQSKTQRIQQFESNFYSLLNVHLTIKNNLNTFDSNKDYFKSIYDNFIKEYEFKSDITLHHNNIVNSYLEKFTLERGNLSHYFKSLYRIIKIIESNPSFNNDDKIFYTKIIRSQLTDYEQLVIFYNSYCVYGLKSRKLILAYNLLKHCPVFNKPYFKFFSLKQNDSELIYLYHQISSFIELHIEKAYDMEYDGTPIREKYDRLNCFFEMTFNSNNIDSISIICSKEISENKLRITDDEFLEFINCIINELLFFSTYLNPESANLSKKITVGANFKIFSINIESSQILKINTDPQ
ncbi:MAG: hypothetical protein J0L87_14275 [Bacteroidetes bacterium]|nr:hypothetical protein [Bacteroidota bacterium]